MCVYCSDNVAHLKHAGDVHPPQQANPHVYVLQIKKLRTLCDSRDPNCHNGSKKTGRCPTLTTTATNHLTSIAVMH